MVGQEHVLRALINGLDNDRLHHAYLFTGTRGVGKTTLARILAKCLNCEAGVSSIPCNDCSSCREIAEGRFIDLIEVDAASRTKVEDTRELLENVQYAPTRGRYKVYLIDEVHMLSNHSFNALLKTLEEPPPHVKFLLATTDPHKLPVTVLSRCMQFNLKNLNPERIVGHLKYVLGEEKIPYEEAALWELGRVADGSMRDALSLTDQAIAHGGGTLTAAEVNAMLGTIDRSAVVDICSAVAGGDPADVLARVGRLADHAPDYDTALADMLSIWHQVAIAQTVPDALDPVQEHHGAILDLAARVSREDIQLFYQITLLGRKDLGQAADPRSGFEMVLLRLLAFRPLFPDQVEAPAGARAGEAPPPAKKPASRGIAESGPATTAAANVVANGAAASSPQPRVETPPPPSPAPPAVPDIAPSTRGEPDLSPEASVAEYEQYSAAQAGLEIAPPPEPPQAMRPLPGTEDVPEVSAPGADAADRVPFAELTPETWGQVCAGLGLGGLLHNTAINMMLAEIDDRSLGFVLDVDNSALYEESQGERLAAALSDYFDRELGVAIRVAPVTGETPRMAAARIKAERLRQTIDSLRADPHVQEICRVFGGELIESTVKVLDPTG